MQYFTSTINFILIFKDTVGIHTFSICSFFDFAEIKHWSCSHVIQKNVYHKVTATDCSTSFKNA